MAKIPAAHAALKGLRLQPQVLHEIVYKAPAQLALEEKCGVVTLAVVAARYAALEHARTEYGSSSMLGSTSDRSHAKRHLAADFAAVDGQERGLGAYIG